MLALNQILVKYRKSRQWTQLFSLNYATIRLSVVKDKNKENIELQITMYMCMLYVFDQTTVVKR